MSTTLPVRVHKRTVTEGLTIVEVLVAMAILGIVIAAVTSIYLSSIRNNADAGMRTQTAQILNTVGRRVAAAESGFTPADDPLIVDYGEMLSTFPELSHEEGFADAERYRFTVVNLGEVSLAGAVAIRYEIEVCTRAAGGQGTERCLTGQTAGPMPVDEDESGGPLEGVT